MHVLKIDKSITDDVATDPTCTVLTRAIIAMGHALGLKIIAEGIEDAAQARTLVGLGCDAGQGYWLGHPVPGVPWLQPHVTASLAR